MTTQPSQPIHRAVIQLQGPHRDDEEGHAAALTAQLENIPRDVGQLRLEEDTPSDVEWDLLSSHFTSVRELWMESGWNEELNDAKLPLHWPLERLVVSSACGEVFRSPWVTEGRIRHLVLALTAGLRFEGPTTEELIKVNQEKIEKGEKEAKTTSNGVQITFVPELVQEWMADKYAKQAEEQAEEHAEEQANAEEEQAASIENVLENAKPEPESERELESDSEPNMRVLEIMENDVHDTLFRMVLAKGAMLDHIETLNLRSTNGCDLSACPEAILEDVFPQFTNLKTLVLTLADIYDDRDRLPRLYQYLPPNVETLRFRSSVSLAKEEVWPKWVEAFKNPEFLPNLKRLSFVLDLKDGEEERRQNEEQMRQWEARQAANPEPDEETSSTEDESAGLQNPGTQQEAQNDELNRPPTAIKTPETSSAPVSQPKGNNEVPTVEHLSINETSRPQAEADIPTSPPRPTESEDALSTAPQPSEAQQQPPGSEAPKQPDVPTELLRQAKRACEQLWRVARVRGVKVEPFVEKWEEEFRHFHAVDERWVDL